MKLNRVIVAACCLGLLLSGYAVAQDEHSGQMQAGGMPGKPGAWTAYPLLKIRMSGVNREQTVTTALPLNISAGGIDAYSSNLFDVSGHRQLLLGMAGIKLDKPESGGFHWLAAREEQGNKVLVASTVHSFGERGAKDPTAMFMQQKHELEIIPQPFPREHSRYRAGESWKFLVRFNGHPLIGQKVVLETQNGSKAEWVSDEQGVLAVQLPDDFKSEEVPAANGGHGMPGADFVLVSEYTWGDKSYITAFNSSYGKNAFDKRSLAMGMGFVLFGMIGALPLLRQRKAAKKDVAASAEKKESV
jgi:hypothetical protein